MTKVRKTAVGAALAALGLGGAYAVASVPDSNGTIHACIERAVGAQIPATTVNVRVIDPAVGQSCDAASEFTLDFNQTGPQGAAGPAGPQGPQGPAGSDGAVTVTTPVPETPAGHVTIASASTTSVRAAVPVASFDALSISLSQQKGSPPEVTVRRKLDSLSSKLMAATVKGTIFATATINVYKPGSTTVGSTLKLSSVLLTNFQTIDIQGNDAPVEEITMVAKTLKVSGGGALLPAIQYQAPKKKGL